ncbi:hypothetical protein SVAN01_02592 [Stagonosporopsis vannaccii]|nr:hypothetical protein SVAN01_02592 [Stagonosporopsis vannaccii]
MLHSHHEPHTPNQDDSLPQYALDPTLPAYDAATRDDPHVPGAYPQYLASTGRGRQQEPDLEHGDIEQEDGRIHTRQNPVVTFASPPVPVNAYLPFDPPPRYEGTQRQAALAAQTHVSIELNSSEPPHDPTAPGLPSPAVLGTTRRAHLQTAARASYSWSRPESPSPASTPETPTEVGHCFVLAAAPPRAETESRRGVIRGGWGLCKGLVGIGALIAFVAALAVVDQKIREQSGNNESL